MKTKNKWTVNEIIYQICCYVFFALYAFVCIFPFYYIFTVSVSDNDLVRRGILLLYPQGIHFQNYIDAFKLNGFGKAAIVSLSRTVIGTILTTFSCGFLGYAFSKKELWKRSFWYKFLIVTMYFNAGIIPTYMNLYNLKLTDTFFVYIIGFVIAFNIILCKTFIESLPESLEESAKLDGAGYIRVFKDIIFPLSKPIMATIAVFTAVGHWNSYLDTLLYIRNPDLWTLQYILYQYLTSSTALADSIMSGANTSGYDIKKIVTPTSVKMTVTMIVTLPVLFFYPIFQKYFIKGIMLGAIKG